MIELSITTKSTAPTPPATPVSGAAPGGFARTFDALSDTPPARHDSVDPRQDDAARGKKLPDAAVAQSDDSATSSSRTPAKPHNPRRHDTSSAQAIATSIAPPAPAMTGDKGSSDHDRQLEDDGDATTRDDATPVAAPVVPVIIAAPVIMIDPTALPTGTSAALTAASTGVSLPAMASSPVGQAVASDPNLVPPATPDMIPVSTGTTGGMTALPSQVQLIDAGAPATTANAAASPSDAAAPRIETPSQTPRFAIAAAATTPPDPTHSAVQPARQAFAAALAALSARATTRASARDDDNSDPNQPIAGFAAPIGDTLIQAAVQQAGDSSQAALDLRQDRGLNGMIDHIETLRDNANARDTRIRLTPDALGAVDVAVRRDGDAVHVRFSSANEATRLVLGDAQPRLAALAEARGVRIAGSSIDSGGNGGSGNARSQPQPRTTSVRPASASRSVATDTDTIADQRVA